jgi:hypothetical protein
MVAVKASTANPRNGHAHPLFWAALNVHFHVIGMDGVYAAEPDRTMLFHPLPAPSDEDIARLARAV